jgi:ferredoxin
MSRRVDPALLSEIKQYGAINPEACFNCGTCTATCPLSSDAHPFPRSTVRLLQVGLKDDLLKSTDPWLCYYCGDCSQSCPKGAEPAETMMAVRRWLTAHYDRSGHGARLYQSERVLWLTIARTALVTLAAFAVFHLATGFDRVVTGQVALNTFAPALLVWALVLAHGAFLGYRMFSGVLEMSRHVLGSPAARPRPALGHFVREAKTFILHFLTQQRWRDCGPDRGRWLKHLLLVSGYLTMLVLVLGLLPWFQTDNVYPIYHPQRWLGYYATIVLIYASVDILIGRYRRREQLHRFSHPSDWLFPAFILTGAMTGILVHTFRYAGWPWPTYLMYVVHVMAMLAMLDTEVGIGKWAHLFYRPLALYLEAVKQRAGAEQPLTPAAAASLGMD